eukprot:CAMPEP_0115314242 /NCGR_PEP_ID=MMETSP0270-20121206/76928_1 /TAXON_ID=71861 /ORGANISM="Scrippsiella trochoidea, Strain CCMP3099" /LENGTH=119 /DNA_ID=CAMNT_0002733455 /DNA_START=322 /DNA_END=677 /DNA_ORIENTATION=+
MQCYDQTHDRSPPSTSGATAANMQGKIVQCCPQGGEGSQASDGSRNSGHRPGVGGILPRHLSCGRTGKKPSMAGKQAPQRRAHFTAASGCLRPSQCVAAAAATAATAATAAAAAAAAAA